MTINLLNKILFFVLLVVISTSFGNRQIDSVCSQNDIENVLTNSYIKLGFSGLLNHLNRNTCKIDTGTLRKYLIEILRKEDLNAIESEPMYRHAWIAMTYKEGWSYEMEKLLSSRIPWSKKNKIVYYYFSAELLIKLSQNWYRYAEEVYHFKDTVYYSERSSVYREIINRVSNEKNITELNKAESILYAVLKKEKRPGLIEIDTYLTKISEKYKISKQRFEIIKKYDQYYNKKKEETKLSFEVMLEYINSVKADLSKIKTLTDYTPPLTIE